MHLPVGFLLRIAKATQLPDGKITRMSIIVRKPHAHLQEEILKTFEKQNDVFVILDRRCSGRRKSSQPVAIDRRRSDRRSLKEQVIDVILSA